MEYELNADSNSTFNFVTTKWDEEPSDMEQERQDAPSLQRYPISSLRTNWEVASCISISVVARSAERDMTGPICAEPAKIKICYGSIFPHNAGATSLRSKSYTVQHID